MRRIGIDNCIPGMILAKPIYNEIGAVLIGKDIKLTDTLISRLTKLGVDSVYIQDARTDDIEYGDVLTDNTKKIALKSIKKTFQDLYQEKMVQRPLITGELYATFKPVLEQMLTDIKSNKHAMLMLSTIYVRDLYLYTHSLNVALYSISMGLANGYNQQQLMELGLGALLHDIGKTKIPLSILEKEEPLTDEEFELIKKHAEYGFEILRKEYEIPLVASHIAYQHHERLNGTGYPRGIKESEIHEYAKIVAIADVYDALTSKRVYKEPTLPHEALEFLYTKVNVEYERKWLELFRKTVAIYPLGTSVSLESGEKGVVVDINIKYPGRPIIRILEDEQGISLSSPYEIDLSKDLTKIITSCNCN